MILESSLGMLGEKHRPRLGKAVAFSVVEGILAAMIQGMLMFAVYRIASGALTMNNLIGMIAAICFFLMIRWYISSRALWHCQTTGAKFIRDARMQVGEHLRKVPLGFFQKHRAGDITSRLMANLQDVETIITHQYPELVTASVSSLLIALCMLFVDWRLALVSLSPLPLGYFALKATKRVLATTGKKRFAANGEMNDVFVEFLAGIRALKAHNMELEKLDNLKGVIDRSMRVSILLEASMAPIVGSFQALLEVGLMGTLLLGLRYFLGGSIGAADYIVIAMLALHFIKPLKTISVYQAEFRNSEQAARTIASIIEEPTQQWGKEGFVPQPVSLEFDNVRFSYDGKRDALDGLSFSVPAGSVVALVGASGSGKTTAANLAMRLWDPESGSIRFGGRDIISIQPEELLQNMSVVFQDVYLFHDTVRANIAIGKTGASEEEIIGAAKAANADTFIRSLPQGYDTVISEGGGSLSGGEKQRLAIARCILKNAPFVILDEATASLDPENERDIQQALARLLEGCSVLVIAHRLKTIRSADKIVVLDEGKKVEEGTHENLLAQGGVYARMWLNQEESEGWGLSRDD
jgi:ATP-binding cassette subfamily B protein